MIVIKSLVSCTVLLGSLPWKLAIAFSPPTHHLKRICHNPVRSVLILAESDPTQSTETKPEVESDEISGDVLADSKLSVETKPTEVSIEAQVELGSDQTKPVDTRPKEEDPTESPEVGSDETKPVDARPTEEDSTESPVELLLVTVRDVAIPLAQDIIIPLLSGLRWAAANVLTSSLPEEEKIELLERLQRRNDTEDRGSVNENIAAAVASELYQSDLTPAEADKIMKQAEQAANERVENELAIQRQRMDSERKQMLETIEVAKQQLETEKKELKERQGVLEAKEEEAKKLAAELEKAKAKAPDVTQDTEDMVAAEALLRRREKQQEDLKAVEEDLRKRVQHIEQGQKEVAKLTKELEEARERRQLEMKQHAAKESISGSMKEPKYYTPKEYRSLSQEEKAQIKAERGALSKPTDEDAANDNSVHPILGPVISDLGYKRIYLASSGKLGTIPIWKKQRIYRHNRARSMAADKAKSLHLGFPGAICLYEDEHGKLSILDGQHRVGMMQVLREKENEKAEASNEALPRSELYDRVLVEVYPEAHQSNEKDLAEEVFLEINKAEPIKLVDMPGVASAADRKVITDAVSRLQSLYPKMFSTSQRCRVPNVNEDNLRNNIFGASILTKHKLTTSKKLTDWLMEQNASLGEKYEGDKEKQGLVSSKVWNKASENGFYLGLESSWLYN